MKIDILILNYNGKDLLEKHLSSVSLAAEKSSHECRVHVVDNLSSDGSLEFLKERFPHVDLHVAGENRVLCSYNEVVNDLDGEVVIFLNNDIEVDPLFVDKLAGHFSDEKVMFAAPRVMNMDETFNGGRSYMKFSGGVIKVIVDMDNFMEPGETCAISCGAFRRSLFTSLGGFDDLYLPGIWEDVDLCYRGQLLGWKGIYEPQSVIWHDESTTFHREYGQKRKMRLAHRNMYLFFWKNITDKGMFLEHILLTLPRAVVQYVIGRRECLEGLVLALRKLPLAVKKRRKYKIATSKRRKKDRDIIK